MNASDHLRTLLTESAHHTRTDTEQTVIEHDGIEAFIFKSLTNKHFRKWAIDDATITSVTRAISLNVSNNQPIKLAFPFGGYKLWRLPVTPEVDWAEFFTFAYYLSYLAPIAAAYTPGVTLSFCSDDIIIERMNNISDENQEAYARSFRALIAAFKPYLPSNVSVELLRVRELYADRNEYEQELTANVARFTEEFKSLSAASIAEKEKSSLLNVRWDGARDLTGLTDDEKRAFISQATILHDATCFVSKRVQTVRSEDRIVIFSNKIRNCIPIGTTKSSRTKFWTGIGVLEQRDDAFFDRILSPEQWEKLKDTDCDIVPVDLVPLKNFSEIRVYRSSFTFGS